MENALVAGVKALVALIPRARTRAVLWNFIVHELDKCNFEFYPSVCVDKSGNI